LSPGLAYESLHSGLCTIRTVHAITSVAVEIATREYSVSRAQVMLKGLEASASKTCLPSTFGPAEAQPEPCHRVKYVRVANLIGGEHPAVAREDEAPLVVRGPREGDAEGGVGGGAVESGVAGPILFARVEEAGRLLQHGEAEGVAGVAPGRADDGVAE
jgi:hypothetical protein